MRPSEFKPGTYYVRNALSETMLNVIRKEPGDTPSVCLCSVQESPTQKWHVEKGTDGFRIRNSATELYISRTGFGIAQANDKILAKRRSIEWKIEEKADGSCQIKLATNPKLILDVAPESDPEKAELILSLGVTGQELRQCWEFERLDAEDPPSYSRGLHIGPIPPGTYWLGQPDEKVGLESAAKAPSVAALTVAARLPLAEGESASVYLGAIGNAPWPNQIWAVESGARGYRLKNLGTGTYLNYVDRQPIAEPCSSGPSYSSEWSLKKALAKGDGALPAYTLSPSADLNCVLAVMKDDSFNKLGVKQPSFFQGPWGYMAWRFEPVEEKVLKMS